MSRGWTASEMKQAGVTPVIIGGVMLLDQQSIAKLTGRSADAVRAWKTRGRLRPAIMAGRTPLYEPAKAKALADEMDARLAAWRVQEAAELETAASG